MNNKIKQLKNSSQLINLLKRGKIGIIPTDTIYGLVCHFQNKSGISRILLIKQRSFAKQFPLLVASWEQLETFIELTPAIKTYLLHLSQPTTVIYRLKKEARSHFSEQLTTIAIRLVTWQWLKNIILVTGPIFATSCNLTGTPPLTTFPQLFIFSSQIDFIFLKKTSLSHPSPIWDWEKQKKLR